MKTSIVILLLAILGTTSAVGSGLRSKIRSKVGQSSTSGFPVPSHWSAPSNWPFQSGLVFNGTDARWGPCKGAKTKFCTRKLPDPDQCRCEALNKRMCLKQSAGANRWRKGDASHQGCVFTPVPQSVQNVGGLWTTPNGNDRAVCVGASHVAPWSGENPCFPLPSECKRVDCLEHEVVVGADEDGCGGECQAPKIEIVCAPTPRCLKNQRLVGVETIDGQQCGGVCVKNDPCKCTNGTPFTNSVCTSESPEKCKTCDKGYDIVVIGGERLCAPVPKPIACTMVQCFEGSYLVGADARGCGGTCVEIEPHTPAPIVKVGSGFCRKADNTPGVEGKDYQLIEGISSLEHCRSLSISASAPGFEFNESKRSCEVWYTMPGFVHKSVRGVSCYRVEPVRPITVAPSLKMPVTDDIGVFDASIPAVGIKASTMIDE